ncbi:MAG TPA: hypothetical protein DCS67_04635 [Clostridiales bacterium UBA8960]|nr:hypothetical protein [Clostridiales bacterium UBA8960]
MLIQKRGLTIRDATALDASLLCSWWRDGRIMAHAGFPKGLSVTEEEIVEKLSHDSDEKYRRLIIEVDGVPVGEMSCHNISESTAEIGIKICVADQREKGHGTLFLRMLIEHLFLVRGYKKIILDTNVSNNRAQHVYNKLGFKEIRIRVNDWKDQLGELQSSIDYELTKDDYFKIEIASPAPSDQAEIDHLIETVLKDNWIKNDLMAFEDGLDEEIQTKKGYLNAYVKGADDARTFLMAKLHGDIVGIIEHGPVSDTIKDCKDEALNLLQEVGTVFVLPEYQGIGLGKRLMTAITDKLIELGETAFCIDSGYKTAQPIWTHLYGAPYYLMKDYWGPGGDHMVWKVKIEK